MKSINQHKSDMASRFFYVFIVKTVGKGHGVDAKNPDFNRDMTYQTKEKGLIKVSI